jgi:transcriptional regulator with XRE-family HTH domain
MGRQYGVSQQAWSYWERGVKNPSPMIMKRIEDDSGVPMEVLFPDIFNNFKL